MGISKDHSGLDITTGKDLYVEHTSHQLSFSKTPRIGIKVATDKLWRFVVEPEELIAI